MDGIQFADGFDAPDRLAFGLGAPQLITVVAGCALAFALAHAPLPGVLTLPVAVAVAACAAGLGWLRVAGRPALDWAWFAARHLARPRQGTLHVGPAEPLLSPQTPARPTLRSAATVASLPSNVIPLRAALAAPPAACQMAPPSPVSARMPGCGARRVVFFSLKGGTGRTTLSTEVAAWLAAGGAPARDTVLIDCDLRSASVAARLGMADAGIVEYALAAPDDRRLDDFLATHGSGLRVLLGPARPASPDWPVTPALLREVLRELDLAGATTVVVDVSPELNDLTRAALRAADEVVVVLVPTASGIQDAYRTTEQLRRLGLRRRLGYVVNRARPGIDVTVAMNDLGGEVMAEIPEDPAVVDAENSHRPVVLGGAGAAALELRRLARRTPPEVSAAAR